MGYRWLISIREFLFWDTVRLIELFSALNLLAWAYLLISEPQLLQRDTYAGFVNLGPHVWASLLTLIAIGQIVPMLRVFRHGRNIRFVSMSAASGVWFVIATNFILADISTTADANYLLLSLICMASGAYLGWTSRVS